jgi:hypothetical protein
MDINAAATKVCGRCKQDKPHDEFYYFNGKPYGRCRECNKQYGNVNRNRARELYRLKRGENQEVFKAKYESYLEKQRQKQAEMHEKECSKCGQNKLLTEFYMTRGVRGSQCKACQGENTKAWRLKNAERSRVYTAIYRDRNPEKYRMDVAGISLKRRSKLRGITPEQIVKMIEEQQNLCAICGQPESSKQYGVPKQLAIDHCHKHGHVRALLCHLCNAALERVEKFPDWGVRAVVYLEKHRKQE